MIELIQLFFASFVSCAPESSIAAPSKILYSRRSFSSALVAAALLEQGSRPRHVAHHDHPERCRGLRGRSLEQRRGHEGFGARALWSE